MASIKTISVHLLLFTLLIGEIRGDWLKEYFAKNRNAAKLLEATTEPLNNVLPYEQVQYSYANVSYDYKSSTKFHPRGMAHLYMLTEKFINFIGKDQAFPEGLLEITDENTIHVSDVGKDWPILLNHYGIVLAVVVCVVLFATVMPIIGLTFCCCRCVGRCGARSQPFDKRYDPCRRHFYGALLVAVTVLISFGVICAFATNEVLEEGVTNLPKNVRTAFTDTELYINNTKKEINTLLVTNFKELEKTLLNILQASGKIVLDKLTQETNATVLWNLTTIIEGLRIVRNDLTKVNQLTESLHERSSRLDFGLKQIGMKIANDMKQCQRESHCKDFNRRYNANSLSLEANFSRLPNVTAGLQSLSELTAEGIEGEVLKGKKELEKIQAYVQQSVDNNVPLIMENIKKTGAAIETGAQRIIKILDNMNSVIDKSIHKPIGSGEQMISYFSPYRYYVCFAASCTLLIILICLTFGLLCGCCGSRPNSGYSEDCCNKGTGSRYLMLAVWLMFLSSGVLMAVALIYFVGGIMTDKLICHSLKDPHNSRTFHLLDKLSNIERYYKSDDSIEMEPVNLRTIIRSCHHNLSLYEVLQLEKRIDISEVAGYSQKFGIHDRIKELVNNIKLDYDINIITQDAQLLLMKLSQSKLNEISFMNFNNVVSEKITSIDLTQLAKAIEDTANKLPPSYLNVTYSLHNTAMYLETHQKEVAEMVSITKELETTSRQLQEHLKFNHTSLKQAIESLTLKVEIAQENLKRQGRTIVNRLAKEFGNEFTNHIEDYLRKAVSRTKHDIGRCWPVSQAYNATVVAGCSRILSPFNGFWMSLGSAVLLFIPAIIISVLLANLYQKSDPYPGPLVEAEYLYDIYTGERDNIPLASAHDKKKKKNNRRAYDDCCSSNPHSANHNLNNNASSSHSSATNVDRARSRHHAVSAVPPLGSPPNVVNSVALNAAGPVSSNQSNENRFDEIASKQRWDFSGNMNAPNFQSNPTQTNEYERPPPYYYPGPTPGTISD
ncbi:prominin-like protein isoform X2 [Planococcus citri]|uniref:prominin-like protein isoform X2 n=1 Tax=Planococcus citri TaxID=170843 RepID=UPI0031F843CE